MPHRLLCCLGLSLLCCLGLSLLCCLGLGLLCCLGLGLGLLQHCLWSARPCSPAPLQQ
jgi:hypothetical protein